jgi:hypothetical protein
MIWGLMIKSAYVPRMGQLLFFFLEDLLLTIDTEA